MSSLYSIRKKLGANPIVEKTVKKVYMAIKMRRIRQYALLQINNAQQSLAGPVIWYLDYPIHPNMGDMAQYLCIKKWLAKNYPEYKVVEFSADVIMNAQQEFCQLMRDADSDQNMIFFQSGYCTQDLGGNHDDVHRITVKTVRKTPIIMFPQTILYKSSERAKRTADVYRQNANIFLLCRDMVSYEMAQRLFPTTVSMLFPDIVTSLIGNREIKPANERKGILICCRNDVERFYTEQDIKVLKGELEQIDTVTMSDTTVEKDYRAIAANLERNVVSMIDDFGKYKAVITDRYHGTIFSLIAGTPVIVIKSNDHKVTTGVDWFKGIYDKNVCNIGRLEDVPAKVQEIYQKFDYQPLQPYFDKNYYEKLKSIIEEWKGGRC